MNQFGHGGGRTKVLASFEKQVGWCDDLGAPFTARLLRLLAADFAQDGSIAGLIGAWPGDPIADALPLRLAGAFHALVLTGADPDLTACYPPLGDAEPLQLALAAALVRHNAFLRRFLLSPPQTNEVGRSAVLLGGFLSIAAATGLPLRLLEIGASAGLNLLWDRYHYRLGGAAWGDETSPVQLEPEWSGPLPSMTTPIEVAGRAGCDIAPVNIRQADEALRLRSYIWADQPERLARIDCAISVARATAVMVEHADAAAWVQNRLAIAAPGQTTVLYHSIMWHYMPAGTQAAVRDVIERAGAGATDAASVAWLRFEPPRAEARPELLLTLWPGGRQQHLATAHPHGKTVSWMGEATGCSMRQA